MIKHKIVLLALLGIVKTVSAQLRIDTLHTAEYAVKSVLLGKYEGIKIENIKYSGDRKSLGIFSCTMGYNKMISRGIILSTGNVFDAIGPNNSTNTSSKSLISSDADLSGLAKGETFDAAILEFDFIPPNDSICFNFFFASEEYPEYVRKNVNDVFGYFLSCNELNFKKNLAILEGNVPITVDNINASTNSNYFIENLPWDENNIEKWRNNKQAGELALTFQFDGFTTVLNAGAKVIPNKKYHIKLAIADVGDRVYDSAIFLEAGSFKNIPTKINFEQLVNEEFDGKIIKDSNNDVSINLNVNFEADSFKVSDSESFALLDKIVNLLNKDTTMHVQINGHTDDSGKKEYNKTLSFNRAKNVADYFLAKGLKFDRVTFKGYGDSKPISYTDKVLNRRVEFVFIKKEE